MDKIYLVPHSHYDATWALNKEDYLYINIDLIVKPALELIESGDYRFLIEQTALLEEIERRNPQLFERIARCIASGEIEIAGGEYLMADTMIPYGETLVREIMLGKRYAKERFGFEPKQINEDFAFALRLHKKIERTENQPLLEDLIKGKSPLDYKENQEWLKGQCL